MDDLELEIIESGSTKTSLTKRLFPTGFKREMMCLLELFFPCLLTTAFRFLNPLISLVMCGHLDKVQFDAASLAYSIINIFGENVDLGFSTAFDTLFAQVYGSHERKKMGILLQKAVIIMTLIFLVLACFHLNIEPILILLQQDPTISKLTAMYITIYLPGLFFDFQFLAFSRYLQNQNIVYPMVISSFTSNIFNLVFQYVFIFVFHYGILASACILSISNFIMFILQFGYILISKVYKETWDGLSLTTSLENWKMIFFLGLPGILMFSLKEWTFEIAIFIAGSINGVQLGAQSVAFQCITIAFTMTVGLGISVSIRVGQYLGSKDTERLKTFLRTAAVVAISSSILCFLLIITLRHYISALFTIDLDIQKEASTLLLYASIFQLVDVVLVIFGGVLKASGRQFIGASVMFLCHYIIGIPIGIYLVFPGKMSVKGMWIGLIAATITEGLIFGYIIYRTNWDVECDRAIENTKNIESSIDFVFTKKKEIEIFCLETPTQNSKCKKEDIVIRLVKRFTYKTVHTRYLQISAVLLLFVTAILTRTFIPRSFYHPHLTRNNFTFV